MENTINLLNIIETKPLFYFFLFIIFIINVLVLLLLGFFIYYLVNIGNKYVSPIKKIEVKKKHFFNLLFVGGLIILFMLLYHFKEIIGQIITPLLWSIILAYLLSPLVHFLERKRISRAWSVVIIYVVILSVFVLISLTITPSITREVKKLIEILPQYTEEANDYLNRFYVQIEKIDKLSPEFVGIKESIGENLVRIQFYIINTVRNITDSVINTFSKIFSFVLVPIFTFYLLKDADYFRKKILYILPKCCRNEIVNISKDIDTLLSKFIRGQLIVACLVGALSTLALLIIGVDFAFLIGVIAGISNIIPYFGPIIGAIPAVVVAALGDPSKIIWVVISFTIIQQTESGIISPKIVGDSVGLHPIYVILSLLVGNELMGIIGMIFAIPIAGSIKIIGKHIMEIIIRI